VSRPILRDGAYYHRRRVPRDIAPTFGKAEVWEPLHTKHLPEAKRRLPAAMVEVEQRFAEHRRALGLDVLAVSDRPPVAVCVSGQAFYSRREAVAFYQDAIDEIECTTRADSTAKAMADPEAFWRGGIVKLAADAKPEIGIGPALARCYRERMAARLSNLRDAMEIMDLSYVQFLVARVFGPVDDRVLLIECARAEIEYMDSKLRRPGSVLYDLPPDESAKPATETPLLSEAAAKWRAIKVREGWTDVRMLPLLDTATALLKEVCGDKALSAYTKADVADFKDVLSRLPKNRFKNRKTRTLTARQAADTGEQPISLKTANDYLNTLAGLFDWAIAAYDGVTANHFENAAFNVRSDQREEKDPFSPDDLKAIFGGLRRADTAKFWAPILAYYMGGRSQEVLKLKKTDVRREDGTGIWYFDLNEDEHQDVFTVGGKTVRVHHKLKRSSHKRRVPLHPDLEAFGFLEFVKRCKGERLFGELKPNKHGKFSDAFGKWFNRYLKSVGVKRAKLDFHSFRHNFVDACDGRMPDDIIKRLKGDARGGMLDRYGAGKTEIAILAEHLGNIQVKGLDLSYLRRS
jgi:integrase